MAINLTGTLEAISGVLKELRGFGIKFLGDHRTGMLVTRSEAEDAILIRFELDRSLGLIKIDSDAIYEHGADPRSIVDLLVREIESGRDQVRGELLLKLLNESLTLPRVMTETQWQLMERASTRLMQLVSNARSQGRVIQDPPLTNTPPEGNKAHG